MVSFATCPNNAAPRPPFGTYTLSNDSDEALHDVGMLVDTAVFEACDSSQNGSKIASRHEL